MATNSFELTTWSSGNPIPPDFQVGRYQPPPKTPVESYPIDVEKLKSGVKIPAFLPFWDSSQAVDETPQMRSAYRRMLSDPNVKAAFLSKIFAVMSLNLTVAPPKHLKKDKRSIEIAEFAEWNLKCGLSEGVPGLVWDVLSGALIDGFSVSEKVYGAVEQKGRYKGKRRLKCLKAKDVDQDLVVEIDEFRNIIAVRGLRFNAYEPFDPRDFVIYTHLGLFENPTGMSDFRAVYSRYWILDAVWKLRAMACDKRAIPLLVGLWKDPANRGNLERALAAARFQNWISAPADAQITAVNVAGQADQIFADTIKDLREEIVIGIKGSTLTAMTSADHRGDSQVHQDTADLWSWQLQTAILNLLNGHETGLIRDITDRNYTGVDEYPQAMMAGTDDKALKDSLDVLRGLVDLGWQPDKEQVEDRFSWKWQDDPALALVKPQAPGMGPAGPGGMPPGAPPAGPGQQPPPEPMPGATHPAPDGAANPEGDPAADPNQEDLGDPEQRSDAMADIMGGAMGSDEALDALEHMGNKGVRKFSEHDVSNQLRDDSGRWTDDPKAKTQETVLDVMETGWGRDWWRKHGGDFHGTFDLADGSRSMRVFEAYLASKGKHTELFAEAMRQTGGDAEWSAQLVDKALALTADLELFNETDWRHFPGPRSYDRWQNVKTQKFVYSRDNPGISHRHEPATAQSLFDMPDETNETKPAIAETKPPVSETVAPTTPEKPAQPETIVDNSGTAENPHLELANVLADKLMSGDKIDKATLDELADAAHGGTKAELSRGDFERFTKHYHDAFVALNQHKPGTPEFDDLAAKLKTLHDEYPDWAAKIDEMPPAMLMGWPEHKPQEIPEKVEEKPATQPQEASAVVDKLPEPEPAKSSTPVDTGNTKDDNTSVATTPAEGKKMSKADGLAALAGMGLRHEETQSYAGKKLLILRGDTKPYRELIKKHGGSFWSKDRNGRDDPRWHIEGDRKIRAFLDDVAGAGKEHAKEAAQKQIEADKVAAVAKKAEAQTRVNIDVPFVKKDIAKRLGARWDPDRRTWYAPTQSVAEAVNKALGSGQKKTAAPPANELPRVTPAPLDPNVIYSSVPTREVATSAATAAQADPDWLKNLVAKHGRTMVADAKAKSRQRALGHGKRHQVEGGMPSVGEIVKGKGGLPEMVVGVGKAEFVSNDWIEDTDAWSQYPDGPGWYGSYESVPVQPNEQEQEADKIAKAKAGAPMRWEEAVKKVSQKVDKAPDWIAPESKVATATKPVMVHTAAYPELYIGPDEAYYYVPSYFAADWDHDPVRRTVPLTDELRAELLAAAQDAKLHGIAK